MKYFEWLKTNPQKGYYWVRSHDCYEEQIDEFTDWYDNAGNVETKFTEQPDEVISDRLTYIDYLETIGHCGAYKTANEVLKDKNEKLKHTLQKARIHVAIDAEDYEDRTPSKAEKAEAKKLLTEIDEVLQ